MKTRKFGIREFQVTSRTVLLGELSSSKKYQQRSSLDDAKDRGKKIAYKMRESDTTRFEHTILAVNQNGTLYIIDGFGRYEAAKSLKWNSVEIDLLNGRYNNMAIMYIACCANAPNNIVTNPFTHEEMAANCLHMFEKQNMSVTDIASSLNTSVQSINTRLKRGRQDRENAKDRGKIDSHKTFFSGSGVCKVFPEIGNRIFGLDTKFKNHAAAVKYADDNFNTRFVRAKGYDNEIKGLAFDLLDESLDARLKKFVVLCYAIHQQPSIEKAREITEQLQRHFPGRVLFAPISPDPNDFNVREVRDFIGG